MKTLALLALSVVMGGPAHAAFSDTSLSVPAKALGGAFAAGSDPSSLFINPAGLAYLDQAQLSMMYGKPHVGLPSIGLSEAYLAYATPAGPTRFGVGITHFGASGLLTERQYALGVSRTFGTAAIGGSVVYLHHGYDASAAADPVFAKGTSKGGVGFDFGVLTKATPGATFGFAVRHANEPDLGLMTEDRVSREMRAGTSIPLGKATLLADIVRRDRTTFHAGVHVPVGPLQLRAGAGSKDIFTLGFGIALGQASVDYAMAINQTLGFESNAGTHVLGVTLSFGKPGEGAAADEGSEAQPPIEDAPAFSASPNKPVKKRKRSPSL